MLSHEATNVAVFDRNRDSSIPITCVSRVTEWRIGTYRLMISAEGLPVDYRGLFSTLSKVGPGRKKD